MTAEIEGGEIKNFVLYYLAKDNKLSFEDRRKKLLAEKKLDNEKDSGENPA